MKAMLRSRPWLLLFVLSAVLHLWQLGDRSYHHDESIHAKMSWDLARSGTYNYDPTYHGPLLYHLTAGVYLLAKALSLGAVDGGDFIARLPIALAGIALVPIAFASRRRIGGRSAWWLAALATLSPSLLYYGRFLRMDLLELASASAALVAAALLGRCRHPRKRRMLWLVLGLALGAALATKENAYVTLAILAGSLGYVALWRVGKRWVWLVFAALFGAAFGIPDSPLAFSLVALVPALLSFMGALLPRPVEKVSLGRQWLQLKSALGAEDRGVLLGLAACTVVVVLTYTNGFANPGDWVFPIRAIEYWSSQHEMQRIGGPPWFHLARLGLYEYAPIALALWRLVRRWRRLYAIEIGMAAFAFASIGVYAHLGEKVPWLLTHQVWPFLPLAGLEAARIFSTRGRTIERVIAAVLIASTAFSTLVLNFHRDEIDPDLPWAEAMIFTQTTPRLATLAREGRALEEDRPGPDIVVDGDATWPLVWSWRGLDVRWGKPEPGDRPALVVCNTEDADEVGRALGPSYRSESVPLRAWFVMTDARPDRQQVLDYVLTRRPWAPIGATWVRVFRPGDRRLQMERGELPSALALISGASSGEILESGWIAEPRGLAFSAEGLIVADSARNQLIEVDDPELMPLDLGGVELDQPEMLATAEDGALLIADTWNHRVLRLESRQVLQLPAPSDGMWGPRGVAVSPLGRIAATDTGNKRIVWWPHHDDSPRILSGPGQEPGRLDEPVGIAFVDEQRLAVCDIGNRRLQVLAVDDGRALAVVELGSHHWLDVYSRGQVLSLGGERLLLSDPPASQLLLLDLEADHELKVFELPEAPTAMSIDRAGKRLAIGGSGGTIWRMEIDS